VKHLYRTFPTRDVRKVYFFCRFNDKASILADTILRSLLRQCLDASSLPTDIESDLVNLLRQTWVDSSALCSILKSAISRYHTVYMIIDGIDECDTSQRSIVFKGLSKLINSSAGIVKLVVASRNTVARPLTTSSTRILDINIRQKQFQEDVSTFIDETLALRIDDDALHVGDPHVVIEVREALLSGAKGM
jgi:ATP/maltotriose-dependent transcriptional regulator MalT